jgi:uncharacterized membrane protein
MTHGLAMLGGMGLGAGIMYLLDPELGRRRRAHLRDQCISMWHETEDVVRVASRDLSQRSYGVLAEARSLFSGDQPDDEVIANRVRSRIGRVVSHPHSIAITVRGGRVTLRGPILADEVNDLISCVSSVRGVTGVGNELEVHERRGNISGLQGGRKRSGEQYDVMQASWSPSTRLLAGAAGGGLLAGGLTQRFPVACVLGTAGLALLARAATNMEWKRLVGVGAGRRAVEVHKTINIDAPVEEVFDFWANYENFPRFMAHLSEVRDLGNGRSHWVASGPAGVSVTWNAVLTRFVPDEVLAWRSEPGSLIANAGIIRFEPMMDGSTRVDIRLCYNPPAGALGHLAALIFGIDPKSGMDEDLVRLKSLLEEGKASAPGKKATIEELAESVPASGSTASGSRTPVM